VGRARWRWGFLGLTAVLLLGAMALIPAGWVRVKMLPYDNKSELEIVLDMPEGSSLERTAQVAREIAAALRQEKEVTDYQVYVGTSAPHGFNGLMRHYDLRRDASRAEVQLNLLPKERRSVQSHAFALRIRPTVAAIAARHGARIAVAEVPPGPPVMQSLVAEVYGPDAGARERLAGTMRAIFGAMLARSIAQTGSTAQGWDWLRKLDANTKEYVLNPALLYQKLGREEGVITLYNMPDIATSTVRPEISTERPEVAAATSIASSAGRPAARSSRWRLT